jgi:hypothetical protein
MDTNIYPDLISHGWTFAYQKYFLDSNSSQHAKNTKHKPTISSPIIVIPLHIEGSHWVSLTRRIISNKTFFFYSDDLNNPTTATNVKNQFVTSVTSSLFNPPDSKWIFCPSFTYLPHSNECGPRSLLAAMIYATHPHPSLLFIIPVMHLILRKSHGGGLPSPLLKKG